MLVQKNTKHALLSLDRVHWYKNNLLSNNISNNVSTILEGNKERFKKDHSLNSCMSKPEMRSKMVKLK